MSDLKPCPKCGNADAISVQFQDDEDEVAANFVCDKCGFEGPASPKMRDEIRIRAEGASSLRQIAAGLNARNIRTACGGKWSAVQVKRVLERAALCPLQGIAVSAATE